MTTVKTPRLFLFQLVRSVKPIDGIVLNTLGRVEHVNHLTTGGTIYTVNFIGNRLRYCYPDELKKDEEPVTKSVLDL